MPLTQKQLEAYKWACNKKFILEDAIYQIKIMSETYEEALSLFKLHHPLLSKITMEEVLERICQYSSSWDPIFLLLEYKELLTQELEYRVAFIADIQAIMFKDQEKKEKDDLKWAQRILKQRNKNSKQARPRA